MQTLFSPPRGGQRGGTDAQEDIEDARTNSNDELGQYLVDSDEEEELVDRSIEMVFKYELGSAMIN